MLLEEKKVEDGKDVRISKPTLIYVPKWLINIESKTIKYRREVLPASETVIRDEIAFCPKNFQINKEFQKEDICGM